MKKNYLCIEGGSRGEIESVEVIDGDVIESVVEEVYKNFADPDSWGMEDEEEREDWKRYVEEFGGKEKYEWGWGLGLGEESAKVYIDMSCDVFKEWEKVVNERMGDVNWEWDDVPVDLLWDLTGELDY